MFADQLVVSHVDGSSRGCGGDLDMLGDVSRSCKLQPTLASRKLVSNKSELKRSKQGEARVQKGANGSCCIEVIKSVTSATIVSLQAG